MLDTNLLNSEVAIIEDMPAVRQNLKTILEKIGFKKIATFPDGKDAIDKIRCDYPPYKLIFCDVQMPELDGVGFVELLRAIDEYQDTIVIMVSTDNEKDTVMDAVFAGANAYIIKPFEMAIISQKIISLISDVRK